MLFFGSKSHLIKQHHDIDAVQVYCLVKITYIAHVYYACNKHPNYEGCGSRVYCGPKWVLASLFWLVKWANVCQKCPHFKILRMDHGLVHTMD